MKRTTNYALPTWEKSDFIQMSDFNDLTHKLDAALKAGADAQAALQEMVNAVKSTAEGAYSSKNKPYTAGSYTGNGSTQTITLGFQAKLSHRLARHRRGRPCRGLRVLCRYARADRRLDGKGREHHQHGLHRQDGGLQHLDLPAALAEHQR